MPDLNTPNVIGSGAGTEHGGDLVTRVSRLENWINYLQNFTTYALVPEPYSLTVTSTTLVGAMSVPWQAIRPVLQLPADRWDGWLAGIAINAGTACNLTPVYIPNTGANIALATATTVAAGALNKVRIGPFPVLGPLAQAKGVPKGENVVSVGLTGANVTAGQTTQLIGWTLWIRQSPTRT